MICRKIFSLCTYRIYKKHREIRAYRCHFLFISDFVTFIILICNKYFTSDLLWIFALFTGNSVYNNDVFFPLSHFVYCSIHPASTTAFILDARVRLWTLQKSLHVLYMPYNNFAFLYFFRHFMHPIYFFSHKYRT